LIAVTMGTVGRSAAGVGPGMIGLIGATTLGLRTILTRIGRRSAALLRAAASLCWVALKRLARGITGFIRAAVVLGLVTLAALIRTGRSAIDWLVSTWNAMGPTPVAEVREGPPPVVTEQRESVAPSPPEPATPPPVDVRIDATLAGNDHVLKALSVLGVQGLAVTGVVRDQRGMRVRGIVAGQSTTRWYSYDECKQLVERHTAEQAAPAEPEPELVAVEVKRRAWPPIWLSVVVVAGALTLAAGWAGQAGALELLR
jgi:hypothetical protein